MVLVSLLSTLKICHTRLFIMFLLLTLSRLMLATWSICKVWKTSQDADSSKKIILLKAQLICEFSYD